MKMNVYAVFDNKQQAYSQPWFSPTHGTAIRAFSDHCNEAGTPAYNHPEDFVLFHLAEFDDDNGTFQVVKPTKLGIAAEYKKTDQLPLEMNVKELARRNAK